MRRKLVFVGVCIVVATAFLAQADWPRPFVTNISEVSPGTGGSDEPMHGEIPGDPPGVAVSESVAKGGPYVLEDSERVSTPEGPVDDVVRRLLPQAESGDARASLALYLKLSECFSAMHKSTSAEVIAIYEAMGAGASFEQQSRRRQSDCATDGTADFSSRGKWLERAAAGGSLEAKLLYATDIDALFPDASAMIRDPAGLEDYKRKSVRYMSDLAVDGNVDSMMWLAGAYAHGIMLERSAAHSYAYYRAVDLVMPGSISENLLRDLRGRLSADDRIHGDQLARSIRQRCCA